MEWTATDAEFTGEQNGKGAFKKYTKQMVCKAGIYHPTTAGAAIGYCCSDQGMKLLPGLKLSSKYKLHTCYSEIVTIPNLGAP